MKTNRVRTTLKYKLIASAAIIAIAAIGGSLSAAQQNPSPNGRNVNRVDFGTFDGRLLGTFVQMNLHTWVERHENGTPSFSFNEANRDDWSVYLYDPSRNVSLQLDLHTRKIMYSDSSSSQPRELYRVQNASAAINGRLANHIVFADERGNPLGRYVRKEARWVERGGGEGVRFTFNETGRDDWSIYLHDPSRNVFLQLDLYTHKVMYSEGSPSQRRPIYTIVEAR